MDTGPGEPDATAPTEAATRASEMATPSKTDAAFARALAVFEAHPTARIRRDFVATDEFTTTLVVADGTQTLCIQAPDGGWERCLVGEWGPAESLAISGGSKGSEVCVSRTAPKGRVGWSFSTPTDPVRRGCAGHPKLASTKAALPTAGTSPFDTTGLDAVVMRPLGPDATVMWIADEDAETQAEQVCWRGPDGTLCEDRRTATLDGVASVDYEELVSHGEENQWLAVIRSRSELGGSEGRSGDTAALLFQVVPAGLRLHGALLIGGYEAEREGDGRDTGFVWETLFVRSDVTLAAEGCLRIKSHARRQITLRTGRLKKGSKPKLQAAKPTQPGAEQNIYDTNALQDFSGAWMPTASGDFERAKTCQGG